MIDNSMNTAAAVDYKSLFTAARKASVDLAMTDDDKISRLLLVLADEITVNKDRLLEANGKDLELMSPENPMYDRLKLDEQRLYGIASDMRNVASLQSPVGRILGETVRPNGMKIRKVSVPFGVIGIIYEARPNVSFDVFSLCIKSGNACILKGGSDAWNSNKAITDLIRAVLKKEGLNENTVTLMPAGHEASAVLLEAAGDIDLVIPRGSKRLIDFVRKTSRVPVIETGAGVCHTYFDKDGDIEKGAAIITNAKTRRVSVCNALDCLIIHKDRLFDLPGLCSGVKDSDVEILADEAAYAALDGNYPEKLLKHADAGSFGTEFLSYRMAVRTVDSLEEALEHIAAYSSRHSESIISENPETIEVFLKKVDAACVYANVSTAFTDGAQFGFGAEIGISTQKLHARGPMALPELNTYKYIITGNGQIRPR